jgi:hypothetical protein
MSYEICPRCKGTGREPKTDRIVTFGDGRCLVCEGRNGSRAAADSRRRPREEKPLLVGSRNLPLVIANGKS